MKNYHDLKIISNQSGFTLLEVLIAVAIFTIGILSVNAMQIASIRGNFNANNITESTSWASDRIESLLSLSYNDDALKDTDGNGTNQDGDGDGADDDGGNFGLDDTGTQADHTETSPDGKYSVEWNIAVDYPFTGVKTIKVNTIQQMQGMTRIVPITYMKADDI